MPRIEDVALFDMDGTLCDYEKSLLEKLEEFRSPNEPIWSSPVKDDAPEYIKRRADMIRHSEEWWTNLPKLQLGWDVLGIAKELGYKIMILTQGPKANPFSWSGKKMWIDKHLGQDVDLTITRDKGLVYGRVLVDDFPKYIERWLTWRTRGVVIMPANDSNLNFSHSQVTRYNGSNLEEVRAMLTKARRR